MNFYEFLLSEVPLEATSAKAKEVLGRKVGLFLRGNSTGKGRGAAGAVLFPGDTVPTGVDRHTQCNKLAKRLMPPGAVPAPSIAGSAPEPSRSQLDWVQKALRRAKAEQGLGMGSCKWLAQRPSPLLCL